MPGGARPLAPKMADRSASMKAVTLCTCGFVVVREVAAVVKQSKEDLKEVFDNDQTLSSSATSEQSSSTSKQCMA